MKMLLSQAAERDLSLMSLDVQCAFLDEGMRRNVYIELPLQDPCYGG